MTNNLEIKNAFSWKVLEPWRNVQNSLEFSKPSEFSGIIQQNVELSRTYVFIYISHIISYLVPNHSGTFFNSIYKSKFFIRAWESEMLYVLLYVTLCPF